MSQATQSEKEKRKLLFVNLEQAERMIAVGMVAKIPINLVGPPGIGKSEVVQTVRRKSGRRLIDTRMAYIEPTDLGGIPYPQDGKLTYLMNAQIPLEKFVGDEKIIWFWDEFDRARLDVQNTALQMLYNHEINGEKLGPNVYIILAGNAETDSGTVEMSKAAANRMIHVYIEVGTPGALNAFHQWAQETGGASAMLQGFAKFRQEVWANGGGKPQVADRAQPSPRSFAFADRILQVLEQVDAEKAFETRDIRRALLAGCVGEGAATELLAYRKMYQETPTREEIIAHPESAKVPSEPSICYALTIQLTDYCATSKDMDPDEIIKRKKAGAAIASYGLRWANEPAGYLFRRLAEKQPSVVATPQYQQWITKDGRKVVVDFSSGTTKGELI